MIKNKKNDLKKSLEKVFSKDDKAKFFFVKGLKDYNETIVVKTKNEIDSKKLKSIKGVLQKELQAPYLELLQWLDTVGGLIPKKNIYKFPFFDTEEIKVYNSWRVCPVGEYWVRRHLRQKKTLEDVDGHCRKNSSGKDIIHGEEIDLIANSEKFKTVTVKTSNKILEKKASSVLYDDLISGWTAYWNDQFKIEPFLPPNYVKALIASESMFDPEAENPNKPPIGMARGLMQITVDSQKRLSGERKELKNHFVVISDEEIKDPNKNISAGIRWLFRKREIAKSRLKREPTWEEVLMEYKGRLKSNTKDSQDIRNRIHKFLKELNGDIK
ncbi:MAG: transglycosylase SLT domain-containing protein [Bacteriovorax sp.]|nr:transglycosylase SLT domain-containing protein [Bacteriovorax sp.]